MHPASLVPGLFYLLFYCCAAPHPSQLLEQKAFNWGFALQFQRLVHDHHGVKQTLLEQLVESFASWSTGKRQTDSGPGVDYWNLKAHPQRHTSFIKATRPNPSKLLVK